MATVEKAQPVHYAGAEILDRHVRALRSTALPSPLFRSWLLDSLLRLQDMK
jgi:hypothetical protein